MKIFVTACNGQLGSDIVVFFSKNHEIIAYKDVELDITDKEKVFAAVSAAKPDVIINCAAITNVDGCEANPELAYKVNAEGAIVIAQAAENVGCVLVHISTDYVFDGTNTKPYKETDPVCPKNVYGKSKLDGEIGVRKNCKKYFILRTAWLYGPGGNNFVKTMLKIGKEKGEVSVVTDQFGNPTSTFELIRIIDAVIKTKNYGIYHATCEGECSWNGFAREIFKQAGLDIKVTDVTSEQFVRPASRPAYSVLSKEKLFNMCGYKPTQWQDALKEYFDVVKNN
jgi:dTDP-4-dehydrorhamnose reductase